MVAQRKGGTGSSHAPCAGRDMEHFGPGSGRDWGTCGCSSPFCRPRRRHWLGDGCGVPSCQLIKSLTHRCPAGAPGCQLINSSATRPRSPGSPRRGTHADGEVGIADGLLGTEDVHLRLSARAAAEEVQALLQAQAALGQHLQRPEAVSHTRRCQIPCRGFPGGGGANAARWDAAGTGRVQFAPHASLSNIRGCHTAGTRWEHAVRGCRRRERSRQGSLPGPTPIPLDSQNPRAAPAGGDLREHGDQPLV